MTKQNELDALAVNTIRGLSMDAVQAANSGHPGTPMALGALGWAIFDKLRKHDPETPEWADRDRFVLSCGHASMLQYSLLHLSGYDVSLDDIKNFRQWGSKTPGHPELHDTPGVEMTTGPLGQGIATAVGMAMAERFLAARFNKPGHEIVDHKVWVIASDGDLMEGVSAEGASLAGHLGLGKIIAFWDDNSITIDGRTDISFTEDVLARYASYGWHTASVEDGEDIEAILAAAREAEADPRPSLIRVKTIIGFPAPTKKDTPSAHGAPLGAGEIAETKKIMGWPEEPFHVPSELDAARDAIRKRGAETRGAWEKKLAAYAEAYPQLAKELEVALEQGLPAGWDEDLPIFEDSAKGTATRKASAAVLQGLASNIPHLVGGSADLAGSNGSEMKGLGFFGREGDDVPRNINFGVREHGMGAALNGMALHGGVIPFGATFLIFGDYMRPAMRLAALQKLRVRYILTHDSIGLGEDGPTHQPIEQLPSMRAIPGFATFRPCDANETREAWKAALQWDGPAALVLTRQDVPTLDLDTSGTARGGYVLSDVLDGGEAQAVLMATGSEVQLALEAQKALATDGVRARVVSIPCWALFESQDAAYRESVLLPKVTARVAVEAACGFGWERYLGMTGRFVGMTRFGASAPAETLYEKFGITAAAVAEAAKSQL